MLFKEESQDTLSNFTNLHIKEQTLLLKFDRKYRPEMFLVHCHTNMCQLAIVIHRPMTFPLL